MVESGIIKFKLRQELPDTEICPLNLGNKERQLRNSDLLMTYEIIGGGFIISSVIFAIELVLRMKKHHKVQRIVKQPMENLKKNNLFEVNLNNNVYGAYFNELPFASKFVTPPPSYHTLFDLNAVKQNGKRKIINGRDYWVYETTNGTRLVPLRTPSALLFQFTN